MNIVLSGALANVINLTNEEFLMHVSANNKEFKLYRLNLAKGGVSAAALDWKMIGNISAVLGIASAIWTAYEVLIAPNKEPNSNSGIIIHIENAGSHNQFWIGNEIKSKEDLMQKLTVYLKEHTPDSTEIKKEIDSIINSNSWKEVKSFTERQISTDMKRR